MDGVRVMMHGEGDGREQPSLLKMGSSISSVGSMVFTAVMPHCLRVILWMIKGITRLPWSNRTLASLRAILRGVPGRNRTYIPSLGRRCSIR